MTDFQIVFALAVFFTFVGLISVIVYLAWDGWVSFYISLICGIMALTLWIATPVIGAQEARYDRIEERYNISIMHITDGIAVYTRGETLCRANTHPVHETRLVEESCEPLTEIPDHLQVGGN